MCYVSSMTSHYDFYTSIRFKIQNSEATVSCVVLHAFFFMHTLISMIGCVDFYSSWIQISNIKGVLYLVPPISIFPARVKDHYSWIQILNSKQK